MEALSPPSAKPERSKLHRGQSTTQNCLQKRKMYIFYDYKYIWIVLARRTNLNESMITHCHIRLDHETNLPCTSMQLHYFVVCRAFTPTCFYKGQTLPHGCVECDGSLSCTPSLAGPHKPDYTKAYYISYKPLKGSVFGRRCRVSSPCNN